VILRGVLPLAVVGALLASCGGDADQGRAPSEEPVGFDITDRWRGTLRQTGLAPFTITATIRSLGEPGANTVAYSGIDCSGHWRYLGRRGGEYRFLEVIDRGRGGTCKGVGTVTLRPAGADRLRYAFRGGGVESRGVLSRVGDT
jgi:hypothetical protein